MISDILLLSKLKLCIPNSKINFQAIFTSKTCFFSRIDLDYIGSLSNLPNIQDFDLVTHIVAFVKETAEDSNEPSEIQTIMSLTPNNELICSSKEDSYSSILVFLTCQNSYFSVKFTDFQYVLLRFELIQLCGDSIENYVKHIENIRFSIDQIQKKNLQMKTKINQVNKDIHKIQAEVTKVQNHNALVFAELKSDKENIIEKYYGFEELEKEEKNCGVYLRCMICNNNIKDVLYKPCGHVVVCSKCLHSNLKVDPNAPIKRKNKFLYCQYCKEKVTETKTVFFE